MGDALVHVGGATLGKAGQVKVRQALEGVIGALSSPTRVAVVLEERERTLRSAETTR